MGRNDVVGIATRYGLDGSGTHSDRPWDPSSLLYSGCRISFPGAALGLFCGELCLYLYFSSSSNDETIGGLRVGKDLEGNGRGRIELLCSYLSGGTEANIRTSVRVPCDTA